ncbi:DUF742 domain-containing protein [Amycolatopsis thermalba]|uniref:DUF742 domain-containing protein n=1 Tax=Amycolatopsis thermalba TaxID=944492 RepID=A0ABY4P1I7_9PSEU|nr:MULTISPECIES: DUF742 domain-containing protein [Amycolatopsis]UQS26217.1 DUF742 domain-containing protein [Amycolatopsis thermalba]
MTTGSESGSPSGGEPEPTFADVMNSFSLDSGRGRWKRKKQRDQQPGTETAEAPEAPQAEQAPPVPQPSPQPAPAPRPEPEHPARPASLFDSSPGSGFFDPVQPPQPAPRVPSRREEPELHPAEETAVVRPYALTGGRTKARVALELETLISVQDAVLARLDAGALTVQFEHRSIMEECRTPRSVAEVAALLRVPIGVARVLISDAADAGLVTVHRTVSTNDDAEAHLMLMERVLSGLRRL